MDKKDQAEQSSSAVISESANVVVQRLSTGSPIWNLTATDGETEGEVMTICSFPDPTPYMASLADGHDETLIDACMDISGMTKDESSLFNLPMGSSSLLTEAQFQQIDQSLACEAPQASLPLASGPTRGANVTPTQPLMKAESTGQQQTLEAGNDSVTKADTTESAACEKRFQGGMTAVASSESMDQVVGQDNPMLSENDQFDDQLLMNTSTSDSLKLDIPGVLDLSSEGIETRQLLEEVMNSDLVEGIIKNECLDGQVAATAVVTTSDGDTSAGEGKRTKGKQSGKKKQASTEKTVPLRRSERHKKTQDTKTQALKTADLKMDEIKSAEPKMAELKAAELKTAEPKTGEPKTEEPKTEEPTTEEPTTEEPTTEEPKTEEPKTEEPKTEEPKTEEPKTEEPKTEELKTEELKTKEPKTKEPKTKEPKTKEPKTRKQKTEVKHDLQKTEVKKAAESAKDRSDKGDEKIAKKTPKEKQMTPTQSLRKSQRVKAKAEVNRSQEEVSEDGYEQDREALASSEGTKGRHDARRKKAFHKRKPSKEEETDSDLEDKGKTLKDIQQDLRKRGIKAVSVLKEGHQPIQEAPQQGVKDRHKSGESLKRETRRRSDESHPSRSDHTYERRRSGSTSEQGPTLFTPDNAVYFKLGTPKEGEGERRNRALEKGGKERSKSWSETRNREHEGEASSGEGWEDDENDSDWTSGDDPEKLWCICRKPHDNRFMICCDQCEEWYHGSCVDITKAEGKRLDREKLQWICPVCIEKAKRENKREAKNAASVEKTKSPAPVDKPVDKSTESTSGKSATEDSEVKGEGSEDSKVESKGEVKSPDLPLSTKKRRLKFYKPPPPKQHCIGPGCQSWAKLGSIYCSSDCIVRHARQSIRIIHQEKEKTLGSKRRDSSGSLTSRNLNPLTHRHEPERIPVMERHTGKVRTGLSAPVQEQVYDFLERHPSYEVLKPGTQHGVATFYTSKPKSTKDKKEEQIEARVREREKEQRQRDQKTDGKTHSQKDNGKDGEKPKDIVSKDKGSASKEKRETKEKTPIKDKTPTKDKTTKEQPDKTKRAEEQAKESVRKNVRESLRDMLATRVKGAKDLKDYEDQVKKKAYIIEYELYRLYNDTGSKYKSRYRSLFFNIKDGKNQGLFRRILKGEIAAAKLVRMSSEQLASKELAKWREREAKHSLEMIVQEEEERKTLPPLIKKTHKGEVEINDDNLSSLESHDRETKPTIDMKIIEKNVSTVTNPLDNMLGDTTSQHRAHLFDLNCKICTGKMPAPRDETTATVPAKKPKVVSRTTTEVVEEEGQAGSSEEVGSQSMDTEVEMSGQMSPMETTADSEPFNQSEDQGSPQLSPIPPSPKEQEIRRPPPSLWKGSLNMEEVAKFTMAGFHVSGPIRTISLDMPENIVICGRIPYPVVWEYFKQLRKANTTDLIVLRFHVVNEEDKQSYITLFQYFHSRQRIGVVGNNRAHIKDMYMLPLSAHEPVPPEVMPFKGPGLAEPRPHMLLGLIVRHRERARSASLGQTSRPSLAQHDQTVQPRLQPQPATHKRRLSDTHAMSSVPRSPTDPEEFLNDPEEHGFGPKRFKLSSEPMFIPEKQLKDPIVAQYANADPTELTAEPYSPTQEEIEAPYDPTDALDVIGEVTKTKSQSSSDDSGKEGAMQSSAKLGTLLQGSGQSMSTTEIATAASDVTANLLTAFSSKPDLTEQQQLLIKLTQQVEDAKKALLDRQIASLQSEIEKATSDSDFSPSHGAVGMPRQPITVLGSSTSHLQPPEASEDDQQGSPQIRRAPADSSTAVVDDRGGATPTKDEPESKDTKNTKNQSGSSKQDRSALDFIQTTLFEAKTIPSLTPKVSAPTPPPVSRYPLVSMSESDPSPPFQGSYEPEYTPPPMAPTYNPAPYSYNQGQQRAPFGEQQYSPKQSYNPAATASTLDEYQPTAQSNWSGTRDYGHGKPGPSLNPAYSHQEYDPYSDNQEGSFQSFGNQQGYEPYGRGYHSHNRGRGHDWDHQGKGRGYTEPGDQGWRSQARDFGHGYPRY